jgi:hypothetical protein
MENLNLEENYSPNSDHKDEHHHCHDHNHNHSHSINEDGDHCCCRVRSLLSPIASSGGGSHDHSAEIKLFAMPWEKSLRVIQYHIQRCILLAREGDFDQACYFLKRAQVHCEYAFPETRQGRLTQASLIRKGLCACASCALRAKKWSDAEKYSSEGINVNKEIKQMFTDDELLQDVKSEFFASSIGESNDLIQQGESIKVICVENLRQEGLDISLGHTSFNVDSMLNLNLSTSLSTSSLMALYEVRFLSIRGAARIRKSDFQLAQEDLDTALDKAKLLIGTSSFTTSSLETDDLQKLIVPITKEVQYLHQCIADYEIREAKMAKKMMHG